MVILNIFRTDSFNPNKSEAQASLAFEKANILYNLAARINNETLDSINVENIKSSVRDLCISATLFDWISNNFANAPLCDLSPQFSKILIDLCLLQAQEIAFFSSIKEEKGLKILARLSLGLMNLLQSVKELLFNIDYYDVSWINRKLEQKTVLHTFIHCLIMAEFWDSQELYDISYDLFSTSFRIFGEANIKNKNSLNDYLKISVLRSEKERQNISYEGKKVSDSQTKLEPYYLANILDFKNLIRPYSMSYTSLFAQVFPLNIIELQSEFEAKANTIIKTLTRSLDEVSSVFDAVTIKVFSNMENFIIELRNCVLNDDANAIRKLLNEFDARMIKITSLKNNIELKGMTDQIESSYVNGMIMIKNLEEVALNLEKSKIRLVLNDNALLQTLHSFFKEKYSLTVENITGFLSQYEEYSIKRSELLEQLKSEVMMSIIFTF